MIYSDIRITGRQQSLNTMSADVVSPEKRRGCASCVVKNNDTSENVVLIFGGEDDSRCFRDCWVFEPRSEMLQYLGEAPDTFTPRSYHSATYIDGVVWIIGGMNKFSRDPMEQIVADSVWCYDVERRTYVHIPCVSQHLMIRTAHGSCVMPRCTTKILIFGGYTYQKDLQVCNNDRKSDRRVGNSIGEWKNDLVELDTVSKVCSLVETRHPPPPRGYMTFDAIGDVCVSLFGRSKRRLVPESIAIYDPLKSEWVNSVQQYGSVPALRHSHRVSKFQENALIVYGGSLERESCKRRTEREIVSILTYHKEHKGFSWHCLPFDGNHRHRFSHIQAFLNNSLHIIGGYSTDGGLREYPSNVGRIMLESPEEDMIQDLDTCTWLITSVYFAPAQVEQESSQDLHSVENTFQLDESVIPETNETVVSETEEHQLRKRRATPCASLQGRSNGQCINLEQELKISDRKWKNASKECSFWKLLAEEERGKYENASSMLLEKEEEQAHLQSLVRELRIQVKAMESEIRISRIELKDMATELEVTKETMKREREYTYQELKTKLDERAEQCRQMGEAYKKLQDDTENTVSTLRREKQLIQIDFENLKRQNDSLLVDYTESLKKNEQLEQAVTSLEEKQRSREAHYRQLMQQFEAFTNMTGKIHDLMNDMSSDRD